MRVLLTNNSLDARAGTELYVRDLAVELLRRGHKPVAYSTRLGLVARELREATVPVISKLEMLGERPDVIHGHHHYETLSAMLHFPETPAISYCHGWLPWEEAPLRFPRILRYVAVDEVCRERLIAEGGIEPAKIELLFNFFDAALFPPRTPLPRKPLTALAFSNLFGETADLPILREACARHQIELHAAGLAAGNVETNTGALLAKYDLVFAKARAAIEAMAVGAAVVLCNPGRLGPLVTTRNFGALRALNFGIRTLDRPLEVDALTAELHGYDPADALRVSQTVRAECELRPAVDRIVNLYENVIAQARQSPLGVSIAGDRAAARYLEDPPPRFKESTLEVDRNRWAKRCLAAEAALAAQTEELPRVQLEAFAGNSLAAASEFHLLTALGLQDYHFLLQMAGERHGAARLLSAYLRPGRYSALAQPGVKFDYILVHMAAPTMESQLQDAAKCLRAQGVLAACCLPAEEADLRRLAANAGFDCKLLDWPHPESKSWALLSREGETAPEDPAYAFKSPPIAHVSEVSVIEGAAAGFIESVQEMSGSLLVRGWAIQPVTRRAATHVLFADGEGQIFGTARVGATRTDVARVHGVAALKSGFEARIGKPAAGAVAAITSLSFTMGESEAFAFPVTKP